MDSLQWSSDLSGLHLWSNPLLTYQFSWSEPRASLASIDLNEGGPACHFGGLWQFEWIFKCWLNCLQLTIHAIPQCATGITVPFAWPAAAALQEGLLLVSFPHPPFPGDITELPEMGLTSHSSLTYDLDARHSRKPSGLNGCFPTGVPSLSVSFSWKEAVPVGLVWATPWVFVWSKLSVHCDDF